MPNVPMIAWRYRYLNENGDNGICIPQSFEDMRFEKTTVEVEKYSMWGFLGFVGRDYNQVFSG
jgi:hypothetical protein